MEPTAPPPKVVSSRGTQSVAALPIPATVAACDVTAGICAEVRRAPIPARRRAGLSDRFRVHDLRHTAASLMIQADYPPKMLQEIMGHASITTTLDLYGHLYPGVMDRYADRLSEASGMSDVARMRPDDSADEHVTT
jgi:hypothetical protein